MTFWLDQIAAVLPNCQAPTQFVSLETYVFAVVRELRKVERTTARPAATTADAQLAYTAADQLLARWGSGKAPLYCRYNQDTSVPSR